MCPRGFLCCVCGVLGHLAPVHRCVRLVRCFACAVSWATWLLFTGVPAWCVVLLVRCPRPLGSCSPVCLLGALLCLCDDLGHLAPVHWCVRVVPCVACAVSWATWLLFTGVPARCVACVCGVLGHLAPVHRCVRLVRCFACAVSWATWLLFTGVPAWCVVLLVRCPGPLGSCSPVCPLGLLCCVCSVLGHLASVQRCPRSVCCVACAVSWATGLLFTGLPARCVALRVRYPRPLALVHRGACSVRCFACAVKHLEPGLVNQEQWKRDKTYLWYEDRIVVPGDHIPALLKLTHESSGHVGADRTLKLFKQLFHSTLTDDQLRKTLQPIVDECPCRSCNPGDIRDRRLYSTLPIPHCANSVLYVDYTEMLKFRGYDFALVVTCGLTRFTRVFPCTKPITAEETIKILLAEWFCVYGAPKEINSDEDVRVRSHTGWYKRVLRSLNFRVSTGIPYKHTSNPLCERHIRVLKENVRIWCKTERTKDWVRLLPVISLMMNSQESSGTGHSPHELFTGPPAWFLHASYPEDSYSTVGKWVKEQPDKVDKAKAMLQRVREHQWNKKNKQREPAFYQEGD